MQATPKQLTMLTLTIKKFDYPTLERHAINAFLYDLYQKEKSRKTFSDLISVALSSEADEFKFYLKTLGYEYPKMPSL